MEFASEFVNGRGRSCQVRFKPANRLRFLPDFALLDNGLDVELLDVPFQAPRRYCKIGPQTVLVGLHFDQRLRNEAFKAATCDADCTMVDNWKKYKGQQARDQEAAQKAHYPFDHERKSIWRRNRSSGHTVEDGKGQAIDKRRPTFEGLIESEPGCASCMTHIHLDLRGKDVLVDRRRLYKFAHFQKLD